MKAQKPDPVTLLADIQRWSTELGFQQIGISNTELQQDAQRLQQWLAQGYHGEMAYMETNQSLRRNPNQLFEGTTSIISVRMDYLSKKTPPLTTVGPGLGFISRYARGRDYHKLMRNRLGKLGRRIEQSLGAFGYRVFVDSAPVLERSIAQKAGIGWIGKHGGLVSRRGASWFFLGEIYTDLTLPATPATTAHCGSCTRCLEACPTGAIVAPYRLDARRCISYLTIELKGAIPKRLRPLIGNRIFGCDDCLLVCPWNRFATLTQESDLQPRNGFDQPDLLALFSWDESQFLTRLEGSPIRRIGFERWQRNLAVALGNAPTSQSILDRLENAKDHPSSLVREHLEWALREHIKKR